MEDYSTYGKELAARYTAIESITGVPKSFFDALCSACEKIAKFRDSIKFNADVLASLLKRAPTPDANLQELLNHYFCVDALRSFKQMKIALNPETKEFLGLFLISGHIVGDNFCLRYESLHKCENIIKGQMNYLIPLQEFSEQLGDDGDLIIPSILSDDNLEKQYRVLIYRWASIISKADGQISEEEQKWLSTIMSSEKKESKKEILSTAVDDQASEDVNEKSISPIEQLHKMIGLSSVKAEIDTLYNFVKIQKQREQMGLKTSPVSYHCVFTGNAGTGKTTVARLVAQIYTELGILKKGQLVETDRSGLVAEYVGQTAVKTNKIIDSAIDGVLFIDEAYALSEGGNEDFGKEAISTLIKRMEDDRDRLVVILAGYSENMRSFINTNIGLQSRFNRYIHFPDYSADELCEIFLTYAHDYEYTITDAGQDKLQSVIEDAVRNKDANFGNGRFVRNLFEKSIERQANRLAFVSHISPEMLSTITEQDI